MTEPLKPRIDFTGTLEQDPQEAFKTAQTFSGTQADNFAPALTEEPGVEEGPAGRLWKPPCVQNAACGAGWSPPVWRCLA
jgi:uncharacterized membrane protein YcjF (UPF0283 family)